MRPWPSFARWGAPSPRGGVPGLPWRTELGSTRTGWSWLRRPGEGCGVSSNSSCPIAVTRPSSREWRNTLQNTAGTLTPSCLYATMTGAEANFHAAGVECGRLPQMLTTTLRRLRDAGVAGTGVWFYYGLPRTLASLALSGRSLFLLVISSIASSSLSRQEASRHQNRLCIPGTGENHGAQPFGPPRLEIPYLKTQVTWV